MPDNTRTAIAASNYRAMALHIQNSTTIENLFEKIVTSSRMTCMTYQNMLNVSDDYRAEGNGTFHYKIPQDLIDYFDSEQRIQGKLEISHVFSNGNFLWLSDLLEVPAIEKKGEESKVRKAFDTLGDGLVIPLYGPHNRRGFVFIGFDTKESFDQIFPWQVQNLAQMAHEKICIMLTQNQKSLRFTNREIEVLELITLGKTNPEIGIILNISSNTVSSYVKQIYLKLGTKDRVTTALLAKSLGLVS